MNFTQAETLEQCRALGSTVGPLAGLDGATLLWALSLNESSGGINCGPRHEPAFDIGGGFYKTSPQQRVLVAQFGSMAACSYGPLQIMLCNAAPGTVPQDFNDLGKAMKISVAFLNHQLAHFKPVTLMTIGAIWNAGSPQQNPSPGVQAYCKELGMHYDRGLTL